MEEIKNEQKGGGKKLKKDYPLTLIDKEWLISEMEICKYKWFGWSLPFKKQILLLHQHRLDQIYIYITLCRCQPQNVATPTSSQDMLLHNVVLPSTWHQGCIEFIP